MAVGFPNNFQIPNYRMRHIFSSLSLNFEPRASKHSEKLPFTSSHIIKNVGIVIVKKIDLGFLAKITVFEYPKIKK